MKKIKGFTLLELIIVMAILSILMVAIIQLFKPIRETYVDATLYEAQRTTQNGIVMYVSESVRFSTDLGLYTKGGGGANSAADAIDKFADAYNTANNYTGADATAVKTAIQKQAEVIIIDNTTGGYEFNGTKYTGRILRRKLDGNTITAEPAGADNVKWRLALGSAYYGDSSYDIRLTPPDKHDDGTGLAPLVIADWTTGWTPNYGIEVTVTSQAENKMRGTYTDASGNKKYKLATTTNNALVVCKNHTLGGMFETTYYNQSNISGPNTKIYIVYLNDKITP
ncbi:MAG: prepilin-type N-terminal cleavage/methylation domain-containing protein [Oscillospiraceae bacterium]|nr:prepilin-type N-terminal cleavage/methylation domain-containing protein [Oscillospiraceae bacterium]